MSSDASDSPSKARRRRPPAPASPAPAAAKEAAVNVQRRMNAPKPAGPRPTGMKAFVPKSQPKKVEAPVGRTSEDNSLVNGDDKGYDSRDSSIDSDDKRVDTDDDAPSKEAPASIADIAGAKDDAVFSETERDARAGVVNRDAPKHLLSGKKAVFDYSPISRFSYRQLKAFVLAPGELDSVYRCYIERERTRFIVKDLSTSFSLCADLENGSGRELIVCKKMTGNRLPHYVFSLKAEDLGRRPEQRSPLYLGKLRMLPDGKTYVLYDSGQTKGESEDDSGVAYDEKMFTSASMDSAASTSSGAASPAGGKAGGGGSPSLYRKELLFIHYSSTKRPQKDDERACQVCIPNSLHGMASFSDALPDLNGAPPSFETSFKKIMSQRRQNELYSDMAFVSHERKTSYDPLSSCLVDFKGRANCPSVKNLQVIESDPMRRQPTEGKRMSRTEADNRDWLMQMGKTTKDCYNMDFKAPFSMFQAFAIAVSRFDASLSGSL